LLLWLIKLQTSKIFIFLKILEGAKRRLSVPIKKKEHITPDLLSKMYDKMLRDKNVYTQRTISACL
jgi:hypothetical protein